MQRICFTALLAVTLLMFSACGVGRQAGPTATPFITPTSPPGWARLSSRSVEVWVPPGLVQVDWLKARTRMLEAIQKAGPDVQKAFERAGGFPTGVVNYAEDQKAIEENRGLNRIMVICRAVANDASFDKAISIVSTEAGTGLIEQKTFPLGSNLVTRLVMQGENIGSSKYKSVIYFTKSLGYLWRVEYSLGDGTVEEYLERTDQSMETFVPSGTGC